MLRRKMMTLFLIACLGSGLLAFAESDLNQPESPQEVAVWGGVDDENIRNYKISEYPWKPDKGDRNWFGVPYVAYAERIPADLVVDLKYNDYPLRQHFGVALHEGVYIRQTPKLNSKILNKHRVNTKLNIKGIVHGEYLSKWKTDLWYEVLYADQEGQKIGYVFTGYLEKREFDYAEMLKAAQKLAFDANGKQTGHIDNYKNRNGKAPKYNSTEIDAYGFKRDQSAPAYEKPDVSASFRYLSDGRLLVVEEELAEFYACTHLTFEGVFYIPKKYVTLHEGSVSYSQFIVVDRGAQSELAFEKRPEGWALVSQNLVTTGAKAEFKEETELGYFHIIEKRSKFIYLDDVTKEVDGYAPYALRFNGGAYTHGVPVNFTKIMKKVLVTPEVKDLAGVVVQAAVFQEKVKDLVDPGMVEYLSTIGTIPRSHKCVRHHTSNAFFLYNWAKIGEIAMIVLE